jgi:hypothetical protein
MARLPLVAGSTLALALVLAACGNAPGRQAGMPTFVQSPPVLVSGGILVQPADTMYACAVAQ